MTDILRERPRQTKKKKLLHAMALFDVSDKVLKMSTSASPFIHLNLVLLP